MRNVLRRNFFLLIGVFSFFLFFLVAGLDNAAKSEIVHAVAVVMRILIVPMYLVWLAFTMVRVAIGGTGRLGVPFEVLMSGIGLVAGFAPYALTDYVLDRWRHRAKRSKIVV
jgi:hypothetical protein